MTLLRFRSGDCGGPDHEFLLVFFFFSLSFKNSSNLTQSEGVSEITVLLHTPEADKNILKVVKACGI